MPLGFVFQTNVLLLKSKTVPFKDNWATQVSYKFNQAEYKLSFTECRIFSIKLTKSEFAPTPRNIRYVHTKKIGRRVEVVLHKRVQKPLLTKLEKQVAGEQTGPPSVELYYSFLFSR